MGVIVLVQAQATVLFLQAKRSFFCADPQITVVVFGQTEHLPAYFRLIDIDGREFQCCGIECKQPSSVCADIVSVAVAAEGKYHLCVQFFFAEETEPLRCFVNKIQSLSRSDKTLLLMYAECPHRYSFAVEHRGLMNVHLISLPVGVV